MKEKKSCVKGSVSLAPIAVFGFKRSEHLLNCLKSLEANDLAANSEVHIFIDGPRDAGDDEAVGRTMEIASRNYAFGDKFIVLQNRNLGLANSIRNGVDLVLSKNPRIIVLEDDLVVSPHFLQFMNQGLEKYSEINEVSSIHGYQYPIKDVGKDPVFLLGADCWGWATWKSRWDLVNFDSSSLYLELNRKDLLGKFDLDGAMPYSKMLRDQSRGAIDSWAICWHASMYLLGKLALFPQNSLVLNKGTDGSGTHNDNTLLFETTLSLDSNWNFPIEIVESALFRFQLVAFFRNSIKKRSLLSRTKSLIINRLWIIRDRA